MKCIIAYKEDRYPPLLELYIHGAPHRRQHLAVLKKYREELVRAADEAKIAHPIKTPLELSVLFINPTSTDLDNLICALYRALDGKTLTSERDGLLMDDGLIQKVTMAKYFPE